MKRDFFVYVESKTGVDMTQIRFSLPAVLQERLIPNPPNIPFAIYVDSSDTTLIGELDQYLKIGKRNSLVRRFRQVEIDASHVEEFEWYLIAPDGFETPRDFSCTVERAHCAATTWCPFGAAIRPPFEMLARKLGRKQIAWLGYPNQNTVEIFVHRDIHDLFVEAGITGLNYEPCALRKKVDGVEVVTPDFGMVAHVADGGHIVASSVNSKWVCPEHKYLSVPYSELRDPVLRREYLKPLDFQAIRRVHVKGETYLKIMPSWYVSRRVMKVLLEAKVKGLQRITTFLDEGFLPVIFADE